MAIRYSKPFRPIPDQIALLQSRGMIVSDPVKASKSLERIGYYRLSGYFYPFRKQKIEKEEKGRKSFHVLDDFQDRTDFAKVVELYVFDKKLRILVLDALERVEIAIRVDIAMLLGSRSPTAHREAAHVHGNFSRISPGKHVSGHQLWLDRLDAVVKDSKEEFVRHFNRTYLPPLPIWVAIETWDFGLLSVFVSGMRWDDLSTLCEKYKIPRPHLMQSWLRTLNHVRNICAHHCRLWNKALVDHPARPAYKEMPLHDHWAVNEHSCTRVYSTLAILRHFLKTLHPTSSWPDRVKAHVATFPVLENPNISLRNAGFPARWDDLPLWN